MAATSIIGLEFPGHTRAFGLLLKKTTTRTSGPMPRAQGGRLPCQEPRFFSRIESVGVTPRFTAGTPATTGSPTNCWGSIPAIRNFRHSENFQSCHLVGGQTIAFPAPAASLGAKGFCSPPFQAGELKVPGGEHRQGGRKPGGAQRQIGTTTGVKNEQGTSKPKSGQGRSHGQPDSGGDDG